MDSKINSKLAEAAKLLAPDEIKRDCDLQRLKFYLQNNHSLLNLPAEKLVMAEDLLMLSQDRKLQFDRDSRLEEHEIAILKSSFENTGQTRSLRCSRCKSQNIDVQQRQTRSADEGMTIFCGCRDCSAQWTL